jgi:D-3-phosphoglycerate dehydrogenase
MPKVLSANKLNQNAENIFVANGIETDVKTGLSPKESKAVIDVYDGLAIRSAIKVTGAVLAAGRNLKIVGWARVGVDNVHIAAAIKRSVVGC